jgi:hypothetical protein
MKDDGFADSALRALAFAGSLNGSLSLSLGILHMLVWKGLITKDEALFVIDTAAESAAKMPLPEPYDMGISVAYAEARKRIEENT